MTTIEQNRESMPLQQPQTTWEPFRDTETLSDRVTQFLGLVRAPRDKRRTLDRVSPPDQTPPCDIRETDSEYRVYAELPGAKRENVRVTVEGNVLSVRGERVEQRQDEGSKRHRTELSYGSWLRQFTMPDDADQASVEASFQDGMLSIVIAKSNTKVPELQEIAVR